MSSFLSWEHQFCLACDSQTDGATYCSESCRLSDYETSSSAPTSPSTSADSKSASKLFLAPAYDFQNARPYGTTPVPTAYPLQHAESSSSSTHALTPSSSHSSLSSLHSNSSAGCDVSQLSDKAKKQLRDYASSFQHARLQRRRST